MQSEKQATNATNEELAIRYQQGDKTVLGALWEQNTGILATNAYSFYTRNQDLCISRGVTQEDLFQETYFAIEAAARAFKAESGYKFTTFIRFHLKNAFNALTGMRTEKTQQEPLSHASSLDMLRGEDESGSLGETIPDPVAQYDFDCVEDSLFLPQLRRATRAVMQQRLDERQRRVIHCRFFRDMTLKSTAEVEGLSPDRIRQIEWHALRQLRHPAATRYLRPYMEHLNSWAYQGTGFGTWKYRGSVQERIVEKMGGRD